MEWLGTAGGRATSSQAEAALVRSGTAALHGDGQLRNLNRWSKKLIAVDPINPYKFVITSASQQDTKPCNNSRCSTCTYVSTATVVVSYAAKQPFVPYTAEECNCKTKNVIYVILCELCGIHYVGQTSRSIGTRFREHRRDVKNNIKDSFLVKHFHKPGHSELDMRFMVLEKVNSNNTQELLDREDFWIKSLGTAHPFGLNDKIKGYGLISGDKDPRDFRNHPYFCVELPATRPKRIRKTKKRRNRKPNPEFVKQLLQDFAKPEVSARSAYTRLAAISKSNFKLLLSNMYSVTLESSTILAIKAMAAHRFKHPESRSKPFEPKSTFIGADFVNKGMDLIRFPSLFKDTSLLSLIPNIDKLGSIKVYYKYARNIGSVICNYSKFLNKLDRELLAKIIAEPCECATSRFMYQPAMHIITGDLSIIEDKEIRNVMNYGSKFRLPQPVNWNLVENATNSCLQELVELCVRKYKILTSSMQNFLTRAKIIVKNRIKFWIAKRQLYYECDGGLGLVSLSQLHKRCHELHKRFVITTADKANNNFVVICKKYYVLNLCQELGIKCTDNGVCSTIAGNDVYQPVAAPSAETIIRSHCAAAELFQCTVLDENKALPVLFSTAKLHKCPYKSRYIAGANKASTKPVSVVLSRILKHLRSHFKNYCQSMEDKIGRVYWAVDNSLQVVDKLRACRKVNYLVSADFSTLYTSLPHNVIYTQLFALIDLLFQNASKQYLVVGYSNCFYSDNPHEHNRCFSKAQIKNMVRFVVDNTYVKFAGMVFKQVQGVPMGGNASPQIADLVLSFMEFTTLKKDTKSRWNHKHTFRYIDDLCSINSPDFLEYCNTIYPGSLPLSDTSVSYRECNYLDLSLTCHNDTLTIDVYNKTDAFDFEVLRYVHKRSNVSSTLGLNVLYGQLIRFSRICSCRSKFKYKVRHMFETFRKLQYSKKDIVMQFDKFSINYLPLLVKFGVTKKSEAKKFWQEVGIT